MPASLDLSGGFVAVIDAADAKRVFRYNWSAVDQRDGRVYAKARISGQDILLHRFILDLRPGDPNVDHRNHNGLDNRRDNLRLATTGQNHANQRPELARRRNKFGFAGVCTSGGTRWYGRVTKDGRIYITHRCYSAAEAGAARDVLAWVLFGEYAAPLNTVGRIAA